MEIDVPWQISFNSDDVFGVIYEYMSDRRLGPRLDGIAGRRLSLTTADGIELRNYRTIDELLLEYPTIDPNGSTDFTNPLDVS